MAVAKKKAPVKKVAKKAPAKKRTVKRAPSPSASPSVDPIAEGMSEPGTLNPEPSRDVGLGMSLDDSPAAQVDGFFRRWWDYYQSLTGWRKFGFALLVIIVLVWIARLLLGVL